MYRPNSGLTVDTVLTSGIKVCFLENPEKSWSNRARILGCRGRRKTIHPARPRTAAPSLWGASSAGELGVSASHPECCRARALWREQPLSAQNPSRNTSRSPSDAISSLTSSPPPERAGSRGRPWSPWEKYGPLGRVRRRHITPYPPSVGVCQQRAETRKQCPSVMPPPTRPGCAHPNPAR